MPDLKISQFSDGGTVQTTDEIATNRGGINTKVRLGSAAGADIGTGPDDVPTNSDLGTAAGLNVGDDIGQIPVLEDVGGTAGLPAVDGSQLTGVNTESITGLITAGTNISISGSGTSGSPYNISAVSGATPTAADVSYTPPSGISGTNVQTALTEVWNRAKTAYKLVTVNPVATTSGTAIDITGLPTGVKAIYIHFDKNTVNGATNFLLQLGDSGGIENTGYLGACYQLGSTGVTSTAGFPIRRAASTIAIVGTLILMIENAANNTWSINGNLARSESLGDIFVCAGQKSLSATLDRIRLVSENGTAIFNGGNFSISYWVEI